VAIPCIFKPFVIDHWENYDENSDKNGENTDEEKWNFQYFKGKEILEIVKEWHCKSLKNHKGVKTH